MNPFSKRVSASISLILLAIPVLYQLTFNERLEGSQNTKDVETTFMGLVAGLLLGGAALMVLGIIVDGGTGYNRPWLLVLMLIIGVAWIVVYPVGWLLGVPLVIYALIRMLPLKRVTSR